MVDSLRRPVGSLEDQGQVVPGQCVGRIDPQGAPEAFEGRGHVLLRLGEAQGEERMGITWGGGHERLGTPERLRTSTGLHQGQYEVVCSLSECRPHGQRP